MFTVNVYICYEGQMLSVILSGDTHSTIPRVEKTGRIVEEQQGVLWK